MQSQMLAILYNIFVLWTVSTVALLLYCYRSTGADFNLYCWFQTNTNRFYVGGILVVAVSALIVIVPDISMLLTALGFDADRSPVALGMGIGTILIAGVNGNKPLENK